MSAATLVATAAATLAAAAWPSTRRRDRRLVRRSARQPAQLGQGRGTGASTTSSRARRRRSSSGVLRPGGTHRQQPGRQAVATAVDLLALALQGGGGVVESIEAVAALSNAAVAQPLLTVSAGMRWGIDPEDAWASVPAVWQPAARALTMAGQAGVPPGDLLRRAAQDLRLAELHRLDLATSRLGVRLVLPLGLAFLPAFVLTTVVPLVLALARQAFG